MEWLWFDPNQPQLVSTEVGQPVNLVFTRDIKVATDIQYAVIIRSVDSNEVACEAHGGPFEYKQQKGPLVGKTLAWWAPDDPRCSNLPPGSYYGEVIWTAVTPLASFLPDALDGTLGWLLPTKHVKRDIPVFSITEKEKLSG
jgi:hypothetical protein